MTTPLVRHRVWDRVWRDIEAAWRKAGIGIVLPYRGVRYRTFHSAPGIIENMVRAAMTRIYDNDEI